ncbi:acyl carrier protein [Paraburkholderia caribensis]|uniref:acyl carrier protein n=1 Tax=Paraburkholderia caribensis TaxID=75105 RepID=UPI001CC4C9FD|nr:acyl carrier protein [Paraburkholderia caribensis]
MPHFAVQERGAIQQTADEQRLLAHELQGAALEPQSLNAATRFESELGFDSLARAELLSRVELAFGVQLPVEAFALGDRAGDPLQAMNSIRRPDAASKNRAATVESVPPANLRLFDEPLAALTLGASLKSHAERDSERTHLILGDESLEETRITYGQLYHDTLEVAEGLREAGVAPGDSVALMLPTSRDYFICFIAILLCNAIPVPLPASATRLGRASSRTAVKATPHISDLSALCQRSQTVRGKAWVAQRWPLVGSVRHYPAPQFTLVGDSSGLFDCAQGTAGLLVVMMPEAAFSSAADEVSCFCKAIVASIQAHIEQIATI